MDIVLPGFYLFFVYVDQHNMYFYFIYLRQFVPSRALNDLAGVLIYFILCTFFY